MIFNRQRRFVLTARQIRHPRLEFYAASPAIVTECDAIVNSINPNTDYTALRLGKCSKLYASAKSLSLTGLM